MLQLWEAMRPLQSSEQFSRVKVQTLLKAPLAVVPILYSMSLRGADPIYHVTAYCTTMTFSRLMFSGQTMEVNYDHHKLSLPTTKQQRKHLLI